MDFELEFARLLFGDVFRVAPSASVKFVFLCAERCLIEKFNASLSGAGDGGASVVDICWCSFFTTLFTLRGRIVFVSTSCSLFTKTQDFCGESGTVVVFVGFGDLSNDEVLDDKGGFGL